MWREVGLGTCLLRLAAALGERLLGVAGSFAVLPATALRGFLIIAVPLDLLGQTFLLAQLLETAQHLLDTLIGSRPYLNRRHTVSFPIVNTGQPKLRIRSPSQGKSHVLYRMVWSKTMSAGPLICVFFEPRRLLYWDSQAVGRSQTPHGASMAGSRGPLGRLPMGCLR